MGKHEVLPSGAFLAKRIEIISSATLDTKKLNIIFFFFLVNVSRLF